jgi:hypothetical protein
MKMLPTCQGLIRTAMNSRRNGLRAKKTDNGVTTYYLCSSVLSGDSVFELSPADQ